MGMFDSKEFLMVWGNKFKQMFKEASKPFIQQKVAKVISVDNLTQVVTVRFPQSIVDGSEDITIPNKCNTYIYVDDEVYVFYFNNNLSNAFVAYKKNVGDLKGWESLSDTYTYLSADSPTFVMRANGDITSLLSVGMKIKLTQTTTKYFIITGVGSYSGGYTNITLYGGTDYTLANADVSNVYYSSLKAPYGFPLDAAKWSVKFTDTTQRTTTTNLTSWQNLEATTFSFPIGLWKASYSVHAQATCNSASTSNYAVIYATLSTSTSAETDVEFTTRAYSNNVTEVAYMLSREKVLSLATKTSYYLLAKSDSATTNALRFINNVSPMVLTLECAYL
jgi:hypothetical protein